MNENNIMSPYSNESLFILGDTDQYSNSDSEFTEEYDIYDRIFMEDQDYVDSEKENNSYVIGTCYTCRGMDIFLEDIYLSLAISPSIFYKYSYPLITEYLGAYGGDNAVFIGFLNPLARERKPQIEIMQMKLKMEGQFCHNIVVMKTFWLKIVQIKWKKIFHERKQVLKERMKIDSHKYFEMHGKYPYGCHSLPRYQGMLSDLFIKSK